MRGDKVLALLLILVCLVAAVGNWVGGTTQPRSEVEISQPAGAKKADIALVPIQGVIASGMSNPFGESTGSSEDVIKAIRRARKDKVKAILLYINSPGGTAAGSQAVYTELMRLRNDTGIKVVASFGDVAASGGYYVASAANHIMANPGSLTGSIGVILQNNQVNELMDRVGIKNNTIKSGQYKDILSPFRDPTDAERSILQGLVNDSYQQFLDAIAQGRGMPLSQIKPLADGRVFTGAQAKTAGLVDSLGNYADAIRKTADLAQIKGEPKVRNYLVPSFLESLESLLSSTTERLIPGYQVMRRLQWNNVPLTLME
jgi:protease IV